MVLQKFGIVCDDNSFEENTGGLDGWDFIQEETRQELVSPHMKFVGSQDPV